MLIRYLVARNPGAKLYIGDIETSKGCLVNFQENVLDALGADLIFEDGSGDRLGIHSFGNKKERKRNSQETQMATRERNLFPRFSKDSQSRDDFHRDLNADLDQIINRTLDPVYVYVTSRDVNRGTFFNRLFLVCCFVAQVQASEGYRRLRVVISTVQIEHDSPIVTVEFTFELRNGDALKNEDNEVDLNALEESIFNIPSYDHLLGDGVERLTIQGSRYKGLKRAIAMTRFLCGDDGEFRFERGRVSLHKGRRRSFGLFQLHLTFARHERPLDQDPPEQALLHDMVQVVAAGDFHDQDVNDEDPPRELNRDEVFRLFADDVEANQEQIRDLIRQIRWVQANGIEVVDHNDDADRPVPLKESLLDALGAMGV